MGWGRVAVSIVVSSLVAAIAAQEKAFEAASVKRFEGDAFVRPIVVRPGQLYAAAAPLRELVQAAYGVERNQVVDGPGWVDTTLFEVNAATTPGSTTEDVRLMLRALLVDRFGLATHREQRDLPVYILLKADRPGRQLKPSGTACREVTAPTGAPMPPPPPPAPAGLASETLLNQPRVDGRCPSMLFPGHLSMRTVPMSIVALQLSRLLRRQVIDRTGLDGTYDLDLTYAPDSSIGTAGPVGDAGIIGGSADGGPRTSGQDDAPALSTALRDQVGLRLEPTRLPIDVVVIDRASNPGEN